MKALLIILLITVPSLLINGQTKGSETIQKQPAETEQPDNSFRQVNGQNTLKSALSKPYITAKPLSFPGFAGTDKTRVIRKGNAPVYIEKSINPLKSAASLTHEERFYAFLEETKGITNVAYPRESFKISGIHTDTLDITHIKAYQQYKGINIYGSESTLHLDAQKERFTGSFCNVQQDISEDPKIDIAQALQKTLQDLKQITVYRELSDKEKEFLHYESPTYSLVFYDKGEQTYVLTWAITVRPNFIEEWKYFIDAASGGIIHRFNNTNMDGPATGTGVDLNDVSRTFDVYLKSGTYYLYNITEHMFDPVTEEGVIVTLDAKNTSTINLDFSFVTSIDNSWTQKAAISAHCNATQTYKYFNSTFKRNSINGQGGNIISLINVAEIDGNPMQNAFWNGQAVFYGNGGEYFKPLAGALDVTAHELGHGVVSTTANLEYYGQSGSINETYADIFASMVDRDDWLIGEDITKTAYSPSGALRNMADPHNTGDSSKIYWQPSHITEMYLGTDDNRGVHINSGIGNHAYYLYATAIGKDKAEKVFYRALTEYLTMTSKFIDFRIAVIQSAIDLFGNSSQEANMVGKSFDAVGIYDEEPVDDTQVFDVNPGNEFLLSYDTNISDPVSLYKSSVDGTDYSAITKTAMKGKVSVTDDGSKAVFVSTDHRIRKINTNPSDPNEQIISGYAFYDNVAISKDGNRLAATKSWADASIYVIDLVSGEGRRFILFNPTTSQFNNGAGGVLYADAIEFDLTGEYLIYDACNVLNSSSQADIYYWDIAFIKVWDNNKQGFGDGSISKLFGSLPENVSIANPVFSKNSPNIIAFESFYADGSNEEYSIFGANLETGDVKLITTNDRLGYPSFSKNDNKIAYSGVNYNYSGGTGKEMQVVKAIKLAADKITPRGDPDVLVPDAKWPVYFTNGSRALILPPVANFIADYKKGGAPLTVRFIDLSTNNPNSWQWTFEGGSPTSSTEQNPVISFETIGTYKVTLKASNNIGSDTISKEGYIIISDPTGINDIENSAVLLFPNPVIDILTITCDRDFLFRIYDLRGKLLLEGKNKPQLDLSKIKPGAYIIEVETEAVLYRHKLLKQ
jgi:Zn-dependent metalloprotease/PKD repeat protein